MPARYANSIRRPERPAETRLPLLLFGAFLGAAVLAKGPAAIVLAGGAIGLWALATKQWRAALRVAHPFAIAAFCVVALPWYVLCAVRNPDFLRVFLWQHNFERYITPMFQHRQPFWYFGPIVLLALLPWTRSALAGGSRGPSTLAREILDEFAGILLCLLGGVSRSVL